MSGRTAEVLQAYAEFRVREMCFKSLQQWNRADHRGLNRVPATMLGWKSFLSNCVSGNLAPGIDSRTLVTDILTDMQNRGTLAPTKKETL